MSRNGRSEPKMPRKVSRFLIGHIADDVVRELMSITTIDREHRQIDVPSTKDRLNPLINTRVARMVNTTSVASDHEADIRVQTGIGIDIEKFVCRGDGSDSEIAETQRRLNIDSKDANRI